MHPDSDGFVTRAAAVANGYTDNEIVRLCRSGTLRKVAMGHYVRASDFDHLDAAAQHSVRAHAAALLRSGSVVSHQSAAAVHGLDLWDTDLSRVHLTSRGTTGGSISADRHLHVHPDVGRVHVRGIPTTSLARTVLDCARSLDLDHAVTIGDSALRKTTLTVPELTGALSSLTGQAGASAARRAVAVMDGSSESPGESISRIRFVEFGIPKPFLQHVIPELGYRVDFFWPRFRIVGEFDGVSKYDGSRENLVREKVREDALREHGYLVVRWMWRHLFDFGQVKRMYDNAVRLSARR